MEHTEEKPNLNTRVYFASLKEGATPVAGVILNNTDSIGAFPLYVVELATGETIKTTQTQLFLTEKEAQVFIDEHKYLNN